MRFIFASSFVMSVVFSMPPHHEEMSQEHENDGRKKDEITANTQQGKKKYEKKR